MVKKWITDCIDFFYPPFSKLMPIQTFRYAACGGTNTLLDIFMYWFSYLPEGFSIAEEVPLPSHVHDCQRKVRRSPTRKSVRSSPILGGRFVKLAAVASKLEVGV
jgi:hypothetical protein